MPNSNLCIKRLTKDHLQQYNDLLLYAFQVTKQTLWNYGWKSDEIRQTKAPVLKHAQVLGWFDKNTLVSQFAVYPAQMNVNSAIMNIGFVTSVATYPEYAGLGLMTELMKRSLNEMKQAGQTLAVLCPYSIPLYRKRGWEIISNKMSFQLHINQLPKALDVPGYVRRKSIENEDLMNIYNLFAQKTHGCLVRNPLLWEEYWRWDVEDTTVAIYYDQKNQPQGYMIYRLNNDIIIIKEMVYLNMEAKNGLFAYIAAHESMIDEVKGFNYSSIPIAFSLYDSEIKETIQPYAMGRIVDFAAFILQYNFVNTTYDTTLTFDIQDSFLEWNNHPFTLSIQKGKGRIIDKASKNKVKLSIGILTTLLLGYKHAFELEKLGYIKADKRTIKLLDTLVQKDKPYISDYL